MRDILFSASKVALAALANLLGWMVAGKIIAILLGAAGIGLFGILRQLLQYLLVIATFSGQTALIQGIASRVGDSQRRFAESVQGLQIYMVIGIAGVLFLCAPFFAHRLIPHPQACQLLRWLALALVCSAGQTLYIGVLTGYRLLNQLVICQMVGPVSAVLMVFPMVLLVKSGDSAGFVLMLGFPSAMVALAAVWAGKRACCLPALRFSVGWGDAKAFYKMSTVLLATGMLTAGTQYFLSRIVALRLGLETAGHYWVAWTISMAYVSLALGSFGNYYMPCLSRLTVLADRRSLMRSYLRMALVAMPILVSIVILLKPLLIRIIFTDSLLPAIKVMRWMLIGDFFKGVSWVLSFPMLAFNEMKWFFWTEVIFALGMAGFGGLVIAAGGSIEWLGILFLILYICYGVVMVIYAYISHKFSLNFNEIFQLILGVCLIGCISIITWKQQIIRFETILLSLGFLMVFVVFSLRKIQLKAIFLK